MKKTTVIVFVVFIITLMAITIGSSTTDTPSQASEIADLKATIEKQNKTIHEQQVIMEELIQVFMHIPNPPDRTKLAEESILENRPMIVKQ